MMKIPSDLGQRILDAARIAAAIHQQQDFAERGRFDAEAVGFNVSNHDVQLRTGTAASVADRLRTRLR
jgi:hypothetical protein